MPGMSKNVSLDRSAAQGFVRHPSVPPPLPAASEFERFVIESVAPRSASIPSHVTKPEDRAREPSPSPGHRGGVDDYPSPTWGGRNACWHGQDVSWMDASASQILGGGNPTFAGLEWAHERRRSQGVLTRVWIARWLRRQDAASIVLIVAVIVATISIVCSIATNALQTVMAW